MAKTKVSEWSSTPGNNTDIDSINLAEGMLPSDVNNAIREMMAQLKDWQAGTAGDATITVFPLSSVSGTNTLTASAPSNITAYATGQVYTFIATGANTGAVTLNINSIGAKAVTKNGTTALVTGDLVSGTAYQVIYDGTQFQLSGSGGVADGSITTAKIADANVTSAKIANNAITSAKMANGGAEFGMRNRLINAQGLINQRGYVSGTATSGANQYTVDRWRVVTSGQNLTFTTTANVVTFTAPAGGVEQVIEGLNLESGTYVLSWTGTATATVGGTSVDNGGTIAVTGGTNTTVKFSSGTFTQPQFEKGTTATSFEYRPYGTELALCQRYLPAFSYNISGTVAYESLGTGSWDNTTTGLSTIKYPVTARVPATGITVSNAADFFVRYISANYATTSVTFNTAGINGATILTTIATASGVVGGCFNLYTKNTAGVLLFTGCEL